MNLRNMLKYIYCLLYFDKYQVPYISYYFVCPLDGLAIFKLDLSQLTTMGEAAGATFNLLIYARNLKGESEKTLLENIAFNDAAKRTGKV